MGPRRLRQLGLGRLAPQLVGQSLERLRERPDLAAHRLRQRVDPPELVEDGALDAELGVAGKGLGRRNLD